MLFLLFFYIGNKNLERLDPGAMNHLTEQGVIVTSKFSSEMAVELPFSWYEIVGALTVTYTSYFVFAVSFTSCVISILIS